MSDILETGTEGCTPETLIPHPTYVTTLELLWKHRRLLFNSSLVGLALSTIVAFVIPKQYKSTAQLMPPAPQSATVMGFAGFAGSATSQVPGVASTLLGRDPNALFMGILSSRTVEDDLVNEFNLRHVYHLKDNSAARNKLQVRTAIVSDKKTGNLTISVADNDPYRARDLVAAYLAGLNRLITQTSTSSARRERIFLEGRLKSVKQDLDSATQELSVYSSRNATMAPDTQEKAELDTIGKVQADLISSEGELHSLEATYGADNMRVRSMQARIAELRSQLQKMTGSSDENSATLEDGQVLPSMRKLPLLGTTYSDLYRRVALQEALYEMLTKQYEVAKVEEAREIPTVEVLDPPNLPEKKSFPPRTTIIIWGTILAFILANAWIRAREAWNAADRNDPRKLLLIQIGKDIRSKIPWQRSFRV